MSKMNSRKPNWSPKRFGKRFWAAQAGAVAIEFAYLAPVLMLMIGGTIEASRAISMSRKFSLVTSMTGDLVAREKDMGGNPTAKLTKMMNVVGHVMAPYDPSRLKMSIIPVMASPTDENDTFVYAPPFKHNGMSAPNKCAPYTLPPGLVGKGGSVIVVESEYQFDPLFAGVTFFEGINWFTGGAGGAGGSGDGLIIGRTWTDKATHSPRFACVDFEDNNCVVTCS
ncbi:MAG: TadE/TadG family type IV pilus assembly protein [Pseudomonadota bacterium]